ncbi:MAG: efflux RND transporter periplasmic adaptor subunit [Gemmatimonadaceae bacterium]
MMKHVLLFVALFTLGACGGSAADSGDQGAAAQVVVNARTAVISTRPFIETVNAIGSVVQRPGHFAELAAPAPTRVARIFVTLGQRVKAGDPLVQFEQQTFDAALQGATSALQNAQQAYDRAVRLAAEGIAPRKDVEQAAAALAQARASQVTARRDQQLSTLRAPLAGVVTVMNAVLGASVDMTQPMVEVTDPRALDVMVHVSPSDAAHVQPGQTVAVVAGQSLNGDTLGTGTVADVGAELDSATGTVPVRVIVARPKRTLRVGETVMAGIVVGRHDKAIAVPAEALVPEGEGYRVFVVDSSGIAHARPVTTGARTEAYVEILSGLKVGETVVTYGAYGVSDSAKIVTVKP